ncbi:MAG: septal ring lytic transglycosylase RlpA family protein [Deltaproteobacteria bacterium]|nr:septal ring lytic transglycosylase RlpA family protein [Deltaproteobacteria bacterium]
MRSPASLLLLASALGAPSALGCGGRDTFRPPVPPSSTRADPRPDTGGSSLPSSTGDLARGTTAPKASADQNGLATWYGGSFAGKKTASGELFDPTKLTAAHRSLRFGTWVEVRRPETGRSVRVRINDRGPFGDDRRVIDLSRKAAEQLDLIRDGVAKVELRVVDGP